MFFTHKQWKICVADFRLTVHLLIHYVGINQNLLMNSYKIQASQTSHAMETLPKRNFRIKCFRIIISKHAGDNHTWVRRLKHHKSSKLHKFSQHRETFTDQSSPYFMSTHFSTKNTVKLIR